MDRNRALAALLALAFVIGGAAAAQAAPFEVTTDWIDFFLPLQESTSGSYDSAGTTADSVTLTTSSPSSSGYLDMTLDFPGAPTDVTSATLYLEYKGNDALCFTCPTNEEKEADGIPSSDPGLITVAWNQDFTSVTVGSCKDLSNVVLLLSDGTEFKYDGLSGEGGTFGIPPQYAGQTISAVWVKSGDNASGDGPGYGEYVENDGSGFGATGEYAGTATVTHTVAAVDTEGFGLGGFSGPALGGTGVWTLAVPIVPDQYASIPVGYGLNLHITALSELTSGSSVEVKNIYDSVRASIRGETSDVTPIPEPAALALLLGGLGAAYAYRRRKTAK